MTRRDVFRRTVAAISAPVATRGVMAPVDNGPLRVDRDYWNDWPAWLTARVHEARARRTAALSGIKTPGDANARIEVVRNAVWKLVGGQFEKTPLKPRTVGTISRGGYRVEKVIFESQPQFFVTANLYLPAAGQAAKPAILAPLGHAPNGKSYRSYQQMFQNLARLGFVVLAFDPIGQGERQYYLDPRTGASRLGPTGEHDQAGRPALLVGSSMAQYRIWDGIRALDYMLSRPDVDPARIGCTGHSGGGTMTMWLVGLDPRIKVAAEIEGHSENFASAYFEPPGPYADAEQNLIGGLPLGLDRGDLLWAFAPKPLLLGYTPIDVGTTYSATYELGTHEIVRELRQVYKLFGAEDKVEVFASTLPHDYDVLLRRAACNWFSRWLGNGQPLADEPPFDEGPDSALNCTATGQVITSVGGRSIVQVNIERINLQKTRTASPAKNVADALRDVLALPASKTDLHARTVSNSKVSGISVEEIVFESEPGLRVSGWFVKPAGAGGRLPAVLTVADAGKDEMLSVAMLSLLSIRRCAVCLIDPRGMGISTPRFPSAGPQFFGYDGFEAPYGWAALTLGRPVVGQRVWDYLRGVDYLANRPDVDASQVHAAGIGAAALVPLFAAALDERIVSIILERGIADLRCLVESQDYNFPMQWFIPDILARLDLPDVAAALGSRPCRLVNSVGANREPLSESAVRVRYARAQNVEVLVGPDCNWNSALRAALG